MRRKPLQEAARPYQSNFGPFVATTREAQISSGLADSDVFNGTTDVSIELSGSKLTTPSSYHCRQIPVFSIVLLGLVDIQSLRQRLRHPQAEFHSAIGDPTSSPPQGQVKILLGRSRERQLKGDLPVTEFVDSLENGSTLGCLAGFATSRHLLQGRFKWFVTNKLPLPGERRVSPKYVAERVEVSVPSLRVYFAVDESRVRDVLAVLRCG